MDENVNRYSFFIQSIIESFIDTLSSQQRMNFINTFMTNDKHSMEEKTTRITCLSLFVNYLSSDENMQHYLHSEVLPNIFGSLEHCSFLMLTKTSKQSLSEYLNLLFALNSFITNLNEDDSKEIQTKLFEYSFSENHLKSQLSLDLLSLSYDSLISKSRQNFLSLLSSMVIT
jgi:hypothetical protein